MAKGNEDENAEDEESGEESEAENAAAAAAFVPDDVVMPMPAFHRKGLKLALTTLREKTDALDAPQLRRGIEAKRRSGRRRSTPGRAGTSLGSAFCAPGTETSRKDAKDHHFPTPPCAPRQPRGAKRAPAPLAASLLTCCTRNGLAQDALYFGNQRG